MRMDKATARLLRQLHPIHKEKQQRSVLAFLTKTPRRQSPLNITDARLPSTPSQLRRRFAHLNTPYFATKYSKSLQNNAIIVLMRDLGRGFDTTKPHVATVPIDRHAFEQGTGVLLSSTTRETGHHGMATFSHLEEFMNAIPLIHNDEFAQPVYVLVNTRRVQLADLTAATSNTQSTLTEVNYESLLRQTKTGRSPAHRLIKELSSLGMMGVSVGDNNEVVMFRREE